MERIHFDKAGNPETPTLVLCKKNGDKIGLITNVTGIHISSNMNDVDEISFTVHKKDNNSICHIWDDIKDLKSVFVPEWKKYFEISVSLNDNYDITKNVSGMSLQESELLHINLYDVEINTEGDILRPDYVVTVIYNPDDSKGSLLNRLLADKASHYHIIHVDDSIAKLQRTFSFDDISIYDAFMQIAEEIHCLFVFGEDQSDTGIARTISVYDLESNCNECGYRGEFTSECPKCHSKNIIEGYGEDTNIFISKENLGEEITFSNDVDSLYNCFRLESGDDLMTATIINCTPSGSKYMWYWSDDMKEDMSESLVEKLDSYDELYTYYEEEYIAEIDSNIITQYNQLIDKYSVYNEDLVKIETPIIGYSNLINTYYNVIDFYGYLYNSLLPSVDTDETTAEEQAKLLTAGNLSPVAVQNAEYISLATANSTITAYAKVIIDSARYKVKVKNSSISGTTWTGNFTVESYYDEEDTAESSTITVTFNDDYEEYLRQQIEKTLAKADEDFSIVGLFNLENDEFAAELKKYSYTNLQIIADACTACLNILIEQGVTDEDSWDYSEGDVYEEIYIPFYEKNELISAEIKVRENELIIINGTTDEYGDVDTKGVRNYIDDIRDEILDALDFQSYIGNDWEELSSFRRESTWSNTNYISDGLTNKELFENAEHFLEAANRDIYKAANLQHRITSTLKNLLVMPEFKPLVDHFRVGNWLRIEIDGVLYKLRLINFEIEYDSLSQLSVEFSDVTQKLGVMSDIESILSQSRSIAKSYSSTKRQAKQGSDSKIYVDNWVENGLNATQTKIFNNDNQTVVMDENGMLFRQYDEETGEYSPRQLKIINTTLVTTNDNWKTTQVGVGEFQFYNPQTEQTETGYGVIANQIVGSLLLAEDMGIYNESGSMVFNGNGLRISNGTSTFYVNPNESNLLTILKGDSPVFAISADGELSLKGNVATEIFTLGEQGLAESNGTVQVSILPNDTSIFTLSRGDEKLLYFDEAGNMYIKASIQISDLVFDEDLLVGSEPSITTNSGVKITSSGILSASKSSLYNSSILSRDSQNRYYGLGNYNNAVLFVGSSSSSGNNAPFRITGAGELYSQYTKMLYSNSSFIDEDEKNLFYFDSNKKAHLLDSDDVESNIVLSENTQNIKFKINNDNDSLEIWSNNELLATFSKGFKGEIN